MYCGGGMGRIEARGKGCGVGVGVCACPKPATTYNKAKVRKNLANALPDRSHLFIAISTTSFVLNLVQS
jgi:hypothetical protein